MNKTKVTELYGTIIGLDKGVRIVNVDLHIHSPASKCFKSPKGVSNEDAYMGLLNESIANKIEIIATTDHNTFRGFNNIREQIKNNKTFRKKYNSLLILCGIEITCYSNHLLAIFDKDFCSELVC